MRQYSGLEGLEATLVEMGRGMAYPATPNFAPAVLAGLERVAVRQPRRLPSPRALTPRLVLIIALTLGLLAGVAAGAYYVSVETWLSAGPRGVQFTNDFDLMELFRAEPGAQYSDLAMGPEGKEIYALRLLSDPLSLEEGPDLEKTAVVRIHGLQEEQAQTEVALNFVDLKDPALWDPGTDLSGTILPACCSDPRSKLAVASDGDLFLLASASTGATFAEAYNSVQGTSLIVRHPSGTLQKVLTVRELVDAGLLDAVAADQNPTVAVVASAPDRLWLLVGPPNVPVEAGEPIFRGFYEVQDPNADGDWSDRKVVALSLPAFAGVEDAHAGEAWFFLSLVAEPSLGGEDRSRSFLLQMQSPAAEHRIYRVSDHNSDGDALDAGEFDLLFSGVPASQDVNYALSPRIVVRDGKVVLRELVVSSFTTQTRVSRISETGEVIDIARAFGGIQGVEADFQGNVYVLAYSPDDFTSVVLYKLKPVLEGTIAEPEATTSSTPFASPQAAAGAITLGVPRIGFTREVLSTGAGSSQTSKREILLMGVDGSGPSKLVPGEHNQLGSQSPGGSRLLYWSDEEVPNEQFTYIANADGSDPKKLTEKPADLFCWPSEDTLILSVQTGDSYTPTLYDAKSGRTVSELTELKDVAGVAWPACTPERHSIAFVTGLDFTEAPPTGQETLELLDLDSGERRRLDGPLPDKSYLDLRWSADGHRLGYVVGPERYKSHTDTDGPYELYVRDFPDGEPRLVYRIEGGFQWFNWSHSGNWLLVSLASGKLCSEEEARARGEDLCNVQRGLVLVNVQSGEARQVVNGEYFFASWTAKDDTFAYGAGEAAYLVSANGDVRQVASASEGHCPFCLRQSFGWSPNGRYLGLWNIGGGPGDSGTIAVLDTTTGETRVLVEEESATIWNPQWWR